MELFQTRDFSAFFSDTFSFLTKNGKHFVKNYIIINGVLLILSLLTFIPLLSIFIDFSSFELKATEGFEYTLTENLGLIILCFGLIILVAMFNYIITYSFTPIYLKLYEEHNGTNFTTSTIIDRIKLIFPKGLKALLGFIILSIPLSIVLVIAIVLVACTLVGIFFPIAIMTMLLSFTAYEYYFKNENRFFESFGYAWELIKFKFWHSVGCVALLLLLSAVIQQVFSFITETLFSLQIDPYELQGLDFSNGIVITIIISSLLSMVVSFFVNIIILLNQGIIFYSLKGEKEHINSNSSIDQIGSIE